MVLGYTIPLRLVYKLLLLKFVPHVLLNFNTFLTSLLLKLTMLTTLWSCEYHANYVTLDLPPHIVVLADSCQLKHFREI